MVHGQSGCDIKPRGKHVHLQMVKSRYGDHWYLPIGRFNEVMTKLGEISTSGHLATSSDTHRLWQVFFLLGRVTTADSHHSGSER